jgi:peptidoglycan/xylan/chitin deacetylase (PgdA/CDA1 family)
MASSAHSQTQPLIEHVATEAPYVALTFDDGPDEHTLPQLLDLLKQENVKATFFLIGERAEKLPELTRRIADEGHEIGNHSYTHSRLPKLPDEAAVRAEITRCQEVLERLSGQSPVIYRAPFIAHDERLWKILSEAGLPSISGSHKTQDWNSKRSREQILTSATKDIKAGDIILMHSWRKATLEAMPEIIEQIRQQGLQMVTVSELLAKHVNQTKPRRPALVKPVAQSTQQL